MPGPDAINFGGDKPLNLDKAKFARKTDLAKNQDLNQEIVNAMFGKYDKKGSGYLDTAELKEMMANIKEYADSAFFGKADSMGERESSRFLENIGFDDKNLSKAEKRAELEKVLDALTSGQEDIASSKDLSNLTDYAIVECKDTENMKNHKKIYDGDRLTYEAFIDKDGNDVEVNYSKNNPSRKITSIRGNNRNEIIYENSEGKKEVVQYENSEKVQKMKNEWIRTDNGGKSIEDLFRERDREKLREKQLEEHTIDMLKRSFRNRT